jgi:hypothetical protein
MSRRRETLAFGAALAGLVALFLGESLFLGRILSPADVVYAQACFAGHKPRDYEPANRLLMDPVLQFEPWLEFTRAELRQGRLPLWNPYVGIGGAPHLANGQSAVFDPFHLIAYVGPLPEAHAWMAAARLWVAGLGMFLLASAWGLGPWGRWFAGLTFPFCGFFACWLLYPLASTAVWLPWLLLATEYVLRRPGPRSVALLALATACCVFGGQIQTTAHILIAGLALVGWHVARRGGGDPRPWRAGLAWAFGIALGLAMAAAQIIPLGDYLARSSVWADRRAEAEPWWPSGHPRWLDAARTAMPYLYGSQRRGHPNLARPLGVQNLNESAGGFSGLPTLLWLAPAGLALFWRQPRVRFLAALTLLGALAAFDVPPVANLLRAVPVLDVIDHRRLTLWVAFGLTMLGAFGIDDPAAIAAAARRHRRFWVAAVLLLVLGAVAVPALGPMMRARAEGHFREALESGLIADSATARGLAERHITNATRFLPAYLLQGAVLLLGMAALARRAASPAGPPRWLRPALLGLTLADLFAFGHGLNPATARGDYRPASPLIDALRRAAPPPTRILGIESELPPNMLMRYGLFDVRDYDSIELAPSVAWLDALYEPGEARASRASRRTVRWSGVARAGDRLRAAGVAAVVAATEPPAGLFPRVERVGAVWIAHLDHERPGLDYAHAGEIRIDGARSAGHRKIVPMIYDPGWVAESDGRRLQVEPVLGTFLSVRTPAGVGSIVLRYDPPSVRVGLTASAAAGCLALVLLSLRRLPDPGRKKTDRPWRPAPAGDRIDLS